MSEYSYDQGEENWLNDLLGKGAGDPDMHGYPGKPDEEYEPIESDTN